MSVHDLVPNKAVERAIASWRTRVYSHNFFTEAPVEHISAAGVLPYAYHPKLKKIVALLGFSRGRKQWETFGGRRDPWPGGPGGMETVMWTAARELCEESEGLLGGSPSADGGLYTTYKKLMDQPRVMIKFGTNHVYALCALAIDYNDLLAEQFQYRPAVVNGQSEIQDIQWFSLDVVTSKLPEAIQYFKPLFDDVRRSIAE